MLIIKTAKLSFVNVFRIIFQKRSFVWRTYFYLFHLSILSILQKHDNVGNLLAILVFYVFVHISIQPVTSGNN